MIKKNIIRIENYFEVFLIIFLVSLFLYIIKDYLISIFIAMTLVFLVSTPYKKLVSKTKNKYISAFFIIFLVCICVVLPTYLVSASLLKEATTLVTTGTEVLGNYDFENCKYTFCGTLKNNVNLVNGNLDTLISKAGDYLINSFSVIFSSVSSLVVNFCVFLLAFFYLLVDGESFARYVKRIIPMKAEYKQALFLRFRDVSKSVFIDSIFIAIVQGALVGIGFYFVGFENNVFWGAIASFFALLPIVGVTVIWIPAVIYLFTTNATVSAILLLLYCVLFVGTIDNVLRAIMLNKKMNIHPFIVLLSILGGIQIFGFFGIFIGPIIISLLITVVQLYKLDLNKW